jgi:carbonic anhydrase/acetyltransferase-like protein (isoleucine patch superfamily)
MVKPFRGTRPVIAPDAYVAPTAVVIGDVEIGSLSSVWFGTIVRGDVHHIRIGRATNIQDACALHVTRGTHPLIIGDEVSIGHRAVVHGCTVGNRVLIAMGAVILDGAVIGDESVVGAGAVVPEGATFPPRSVILGVPARRVREVRDSDLARILNARDNYIELSGLYREEEP